MVAFAAFLTVLTDVLLFFSALDKMR